MSVLKRASSSLKSPVSVALSGCLSVDLHIQNNDTSSDAETFCAMPTDSVFTRSE